METPETPKKYKFINIPDNAIVTVEMSGFYIKNIQAILIKLGEELGKEGLKRILEKLKDGKPPETVQEALVYSLVALVDTAEVAAKEQNKTIIEEYTEEQIRKAIEDLDS